jgi:hypothetical protein
MILSFCLLVSYSNPRLGDIFFALVHANIVTNLRRGQTMKLRLLMIALAILFGVVETFETVTNTVKAATMTDNDGMSDDDADDEETSGDCADSDVYHPVN